ncbi:MAG: hypothetical protein UX60_C0044G0012 [Berkelbacteria bacterium GW2011_GWA2_46_7]|uniref:Uncharacterized protein n=1 Tax=Berkelbacteria bacterium GW2011_GWA2_46_7 TaxID=1618335 RepID=A0A0G1QCX4_9BACT|nr:MAG: hypothetical protein UX60_C0044G0012 [Berkelbacteria bacterium GW2011_GWA2_46_7]
MPKLATSAWFRGVGRRKRAVAQVRLVNGSLLGAGECRDRLTLSFLVLLALWLKSILTGAQPFVRVAT